MATLFTEYICVRMIDTFNYLNAYLSRSTPAQVRDHIARHKCFVISLLLLAAAFLGIPIALFCLQLDGTIHWNWYIFFIPIYVLDISLISRNIVDAVESSAPFFTRQKIRNAFRMLLLFIPQALFPLRLNETVLWPYWSIVLPYFIWEVDNCVTLWRVYLPDEGNQVDLSLALLRLLQVWLIVDKADNILWKKSSDGSHSEDGEDAPNTWGNVLTPYLVAQTIIIGACCLLGMSTEPRVTEIILRLFIFLLLIDPSLIAVQWMQSQSFPVLYVLIPYGILLFMIIVAILCLKPIEYRRRRGRRRSERTPLLDLSTQPEVV